MMHSPDHRLPDALSIIIFGATGDLTLHKLMPSLLRLFQHQRMPKAFDIIACGRRDISREQYQQLVLPQLETASEVTDQTFCIDAFLDRIHYFTGNLNDSYMYLRLDSFLQADKFANDMVFYLAIGSEQLPICIENLANQRLLNNNEHIRRVVVEKPIGHDLASATATEQILSDHLDEDQIFRIDHYLAKEMVQNILVFRFANIFMEPLWNHHYIDHIQITHSETLGVGTRGGFYDSHGALRDMIQSHILQLLAIIAMEAPLSASADDLRAEKIKALRAVRPMSNADINQYCYRAQ